MVYKEHIIELFVNGKKVELESQKSLNLRFNNVLYDPTKITSTQAEYSFEFEVPATPHNNVIFDYANNLSKLDKFHQRYNAEVYADGTVIFKGTLTVNSYKDNKYSLNLVSVKNYSLEDIFGDMTMNQIKDFKIDFNGAESINYYNSMDDAIATFPLVSYGAFQKSPKSEDVVREYTSKFDLDEYNRWYIESFYPSHNMLATLKKAFESKDYNVGGSAFNDRILKNIYMSVNLADDQYPDYNLGNPRFGSVELNATLTTSGTPYTQELSFPYFKMYDKSNNEYKYNFSNIDIYDVLGEGSVTLADPSTPSYMYQPDESVIVIPADGFYKIEISASTTLNTTGTIKATQYVMDMIDNTLSEQDLDLNVGLNEITPLEIHLIRNYDDNIELIKGKNNKYYANGNPNVQSYTVNGRTYQNATTWQTCFPHEDLYGAEIPTEKNDLTIKSRGGRRGSASSDDDSTGGNLGGRRARTRGGTIDITGGGRYYSPAKYGYVYNNGEIMCYDQAVSEAFICGLSTMYGGVTSVMKNGYSWSKNNATLNEAFYPEVGYSFLSRQEGTGDLVTEQTNFNENNYINTPISYISSNNTSMNGYVSCMVKLNKDDIIRLVAVQRGYYKSSTPVRYITTSNVKLKISAYSPRSYNVLEATHSNVYNLPTEFDVQLNLANFFNREKNVSDWVQNIADAFNLEILQNGNSVEINTKSKINESIISAVDIDDRVNSADAEAHMIEYPKSMAVKYKIDTDEWGFERSAVESQGGDESILNDVDWKKYGDSGFSIVELNDDSYETSTSDKNVQFSYTWYDNFYWYAVSSSFEKTSNEPVMINIPVISKYSYMIDGYDYEESMKHDGYGLTQRFWFKPSFAAGNSAYVWTRTYPVEMIYIAATRNVYPNYANPQMALSYKNNEASILTKYFNMNAYLASNYVEVDVYLTPDEFNRIKNGCLVHFDSDLYYPVEIQGYDPSGYNQTTLKLMKKIV